MIFLRAGCLVLSVHLLLAQNAGPVQVGSLQLHRVFDRELGAGQAEEYTVNVDAGRFVRVVARQMGVDVAVKVLDPQGKTIVEADRPNGDSGPEAASFIGVDAGTYRIRVSNGSESAGHYQMELLDSRAPTDEDRSRIEAERTEFQGERERQASTREAKVHSIELYEHAATIWQQLKDSYEEGLCRLAIGGVRNDFGETQKALDYYNQSLSLFRSVNDSRGIAGALNDIGDAYDSLNEKQKALDAFIQSLPLFRTLGDRRGEAIALLRIGRAYDDLDEKPKALDYYTQALPLARAIKHRPAEAAALNNIANIYSVRGEKRKALEYYLQVLALFHAAGSLSGEATARNNLGMVYADLGEPEKSLENYGQALTLSRGAGDRSAEAITLANMGGVYSGLGEKQKALDLLGQALPVFHAAGDRSREATTLNSIGSVYSDLGEKQKALEYFNQALPLVHAAGDRAGEASTLNNMGVAYLSFGEKQKAVECFVRALPLARAIGYRQGQAVALVNIGSLYLDLGNKQKALDCYTQALPILREVGDRSMQANVVHNMGNVYDTLGDRQKALEYYGQALPILRATGNRAGEADTLNNMGGVYFTLGDFPKSLEYFTQALPLRRAVSDRAREAMTLINIARIFEKTQPELAIVLAKQAVNLLQTMRRDNRELEESLRKTFDKSIEYNYRFLAGVLVDRRRFGEAEEVLNLLKDKEAADFIRRDAVAQQLKAATLLESERKALERYEQIVTRVVSDGQAKSALVAKAAKEPLSGEESLRSQELDRDLAAANTVLLRYFDDQEKALAVNSAAAKRVGELRESEGLQDTLQALGPDVVAIYTLVLPDRYTAMLISSGARKAYSTTIAEAELNRKVFDFRQQLQNPGSDPLPLAQELYKIVFPEGLRQDLDSMGAKTIMWSIDSTLRYVPIAALHDGEHYLVSRFRNSLITPASLTRLTEGSQALWKGLGFGVSQANGNFSALPAVPDELRRIFRQGDSGDAPVPGRVRLDRDFTRDAFEAGMRQPEKSVVHIATHFDSRPGVAANSHLLLGDGTEVSLAEIEAMPRLFSGVDLLTLSACSTAFTNGTEDGREVDSFGTIAQRLGAKGVIASLWSVNDEATARLMETMYRIRQAKPELGKNEALRQAQEQMAGGTLKPAAADAGDRGVHVAVDKHIASGWSHPYYWAAFILIGNWK